MDRIGSSVHDLIGEQVAEDVAKAHEQTHGRFGFSVDFGSGVDEFLVAGSSSNQVQPHRPWAARKAKASHVTGQHVGQCGERVRSPWCVRPGVEGRPRFHLVEGKRRDANAAAVFDLVAQRRQRGEDVAEHDGGVELRIPLNRL